MPNIDYEFQLNDALKSLKAERAAIVSEMENFTPVKGFSDSVNSAFVTEMIEDLTILHESVQDCENELLQRGFKVDLDNFSLEETIANFKAKVTKLNNQEDILEEEENSLEIEEPEDVEELEGSIDDELENQEESEDAEELEEDLPEDAESLENEEEELVDVSLNDVIQPPVIENLPDIRPIGEKIVPTLLNKTKTEPKLDLDIVNSAGDEGLTNS